MPRPPGRIRRLAEELDETGFRFPGDDDAVALVLEELEYALHPAVHERRVPTFGSVVAPSIEPEAWEDPTDLEVLRRSIGTFPLPQARRFADGLSSWLVRWSDGRNDSVVFDRAAGSERDLVVLAEATGGTLLQRHPMGVVRAVGSFGVLRYDGLTWHHEPPVSGWIDTMAACSELGDRRVLSTLLTFAVHDLGARGIGAILVYRPDIERDGPFQLRLPVPPPLQIGRPADLAPLSHVLAQVDGAAVFDIGGTLRELGVRLVPTPAAEIEVAGYRGMRHTAGRRYSRDDSYAHGGGRQRGRARHGVPRRRDRRPIRRGLRPADSVPTFRTK